MKDEGYIRNLKDQRKAKPVRGQKMATVQPKMGDKRPPTPGKPMPVKKSGRRG